MAAVPGQQSKTGLHIEQRKKVKNELAELGRDFCNKTTIHGPSYLSDAKGLARLFWVVALLAGFTLSVYYIHDSILDWRYNPVIISFEDVSKPVEEIQV